MGLCVCILPSVLQDVWEEVIPVGGLSEKFTTLLVTMPAHIRELPVYMLLPIWSIASTLAYGVQLTISDEVGLP